MKISTLLLDSAKHWNESNARLFSAAFSYYAPLALIPLIIFSISIVGLIYGPNIVKDVFLNWGSVLGPDLTNLIRIAVSNLNTEAESFKIPVLGVLFFSSVLIIALNVLTAGFNRLWNINISGFRSNFYETIRSILFIFILQAYFVIIIAFEIFLTAIQMRGGDLISTLFIFINTALLFILLYRFLTIRPPSLAGCTIGSIVATIIFIGAKSLVGIYIISTGSLTIYGAAGLILVLLIWVYILAALIYYGASIAYMYDKIVSKNQLNNRQI
jgi:membrane protein